MNGNSNWNSLFQHELQQAEAARATGNEGMARVCARRAAGIAVGEYLECKGFPDVGQSSIDRLECLTKLPGISSDLAQIANHLLMHVTTEHKLPIEIDLIAEARQLMQALFGKAIE